MKANISDRILNFIIMFEGVALTYLSFLYLEVWGAVISIGIGLFGSVLFGLSLYWMFGRKNETH